MSDETREQIKRDALKYCNKQPSESYEQGKRVGFEIGANHQHPIAFGLGKNDILIAIKKITDRNYALHIHTDQVYARPLKGGLGSSVYLNGDVTLFQALEIVYNDLFETKKKP